MTLPSANSHDTSKYLILGQMYFTLVVIGGIITLRNILQIPTESKNVAIFGLSWERMLLFGCILIVVLVATAFLITSWFRQPAFIHFQENLNVKLQQKNFFSLSILFCTIIIFGSIYLIFLIPDVSEPFTRAYFDRLQPLIAWIAALSAQTLIALFLLRYEFDLKTFKPPSRIIYQIATIFSLLMLLWILISQTQLGLKRSDAGAGWNALGTPLLEIQVLMAWIIAVIFIGFVLWVENQPSLMERIRRIHLPRIDLIITILVWVTAFATWNIIPLSSNWFAAPPRPPNDAFYPNSDAYLYDTTGQTLLTGEGFKTQNSPFAIRPLYALFLAGIHAIGSPDYESIIWMQVAVLALIPVLLYWITLNIHNRFSALIAASLLIFREANAILLGSSITTSNSKLLMADLPTTLGVMLLVLVFIRWLQNPTQRVNLTLIAGGLTGAFMLVRPEFVVLLPFLGIAALLEIIFQPTYDNRPLLSLSSSENDNSPSENTKKPTRARIWFKGMLFIIVGVVLFLLPWIWRNYQITGTIFLDSPHYRSDLFALRYQKNENENETTSQKTPDSSSEEIQSTQISTESGTLKATSTPQISYQAGENAETFAGRMFSNALNYAKNNIREVLYFVSNHFLNSQIQSVLYLPVTYRFPDSILGFLGHKDPALFWEQCCSAQGYIRRLPFWFKWDGNIPRQSIIPLALNLFLISVGIVISWKPNKFIALLPIFASIGYSLVNAIVRNSGGRYILPIDWVGILYFSIGLGHLTIWAIDYFRDSELPIMELHEIRRQTDTGITRWRIKNPIVISALILLTGCILPLSEKIVKPLYPNNLQLDRQDQLLSYIDIPVESFLTEGGSIVHGRALYPRFHEANQGESGTRRTPFSPLPYARFDFYMVGPYNGGIVIAQGNSPEQFPNGVDVLAIGCPTDEYFDALLVVSYDDFGGPGEILLRQPFPEEPHCPLPPTN